MSISSALRYSLCLWMLLLGSKGMAAEISTWTSSSGAQVEARFVGIDGDSLVVLEQEDGKQLSIPLHLLSEADQARVQDLIPEEEASEEEDFSTKARNPWLPVFESGPYTGNFVVYDSPLYLFLMDGAGASIFYLKDNAGELVGPSIPMRGFRIHYVAPNESKEGKISSFSRPVEKLTGPAVHPMMNPTTFVLNGLFQDQVVFKKTYTFTKTSVAIDFEITDPRDIQYPSRGGETGFKFPASADIANDVEQVERKKILDGWDLSLYPASGSKSSRPVVIPYWEAVQHRPQDIERAVMKGPWGERKLTVTFRGQPGRAGLYQGKSLWEGFSMGFSWHWAKVKKVGLTVSVE